MMTFDPGAAVRERAAVAFGDVADTFAPPEFAVLPTMTGGTDVVNALQTAAAMVRDGFAGDTANRDSSYRIAVAMAAAALRCLLRLDWQPVDDAPAPPASGVGREGAPVSS